MRKRAVYGVHRFSLDEYCRYEALPPKPATSASQAVRLAKEAAAFYLGVVAFKQITDPGTGQTAAPVVLFKAGNVPAELSGESLAKRVVWLSG